jgi:hypothetical protein
MDRILPRGAIVSGVRSETAHIYCSLLKPRAKRTKMKPVRFLPRTADFRWLARASRTVNVQWMGNLGVPLASPDERTIVQGPRWGIINCQVRSCKRKCIGPDVDTKIPWSAEKIAAKFPTTEKSAHPTKRDAPHSTTHGIGGTPVRKCV